MIDLAFLIFGLSQGAIYSILVMGLVLTYRMSRFLNLAHGAIGILSGYIYWQLASDWQWPPLLAALFVVGIVAPLIGIAVGGGLFKVLSRRDEATKIAASVALILLIDSLIRVGWKGQVKIVPSPFMGGGVRLDGILVEWIHFIHILLAVFLGSGLYWLLARTVLGVKLRAVSESRNQAAVFGVNVLRVDAFGWALASSLAAIAGILAASIGALSGQTLTLMLAAALAAASVGRLIDVRWASLGACALGIIQVELARIPPSLQETFGTVNAAAPFLILAGALIVFASKRLDVGDEVSGGLDDPQAGSAQRGTRLRRDHKASLGTDQVTRNRETVRRGGVLVGGLALVLIAGALTDGGILYRLTLAAIWTVSFSSIALLNGLGGQTSLCQVTFMGLGALAGSRVALHCETPPGALPYCQSRADGYIWAGLVVAGLVSAFAGVIVGAGTARVRGIMLAVTTFAFAVLADNVVFSSVDLTGGMAGLATPRPHVATSPHSYFALCAVIAVFSVWALWNIGGSGSGRVLRYLEQSPTAARAFGVHTAFYRLSIFALSTFVAGMSGFLLAGLNNRFLPIDYNAFVSLAVLTVMYAVGVQAVASPAIAALFFVFTPYLMADVSEVIKGLDHQTVFALAALAALGVRGGLFGGLQRIFRRGVERWGRAKQRDRWGADGLAPSDTRMATGSRGE